MAAHPSHSSTQATHLALSAVRAALAATRLAGREPVLECASTDANIPIARGIPAIAIGAGGTGGGAHTLAEWYDDTGSGTGLARARYGDRDGRLTGVLAHCACSHGSGQAVRRS